MNPSDMNHDLAEQIANLVDSEEVVRLAQALVKIDSVAAPGRPHEENVVNFLEKRLRAAGLKVVRQEVEPLRPNLMAEWSGVDAGALLLLEGHTDVVTEGDRQAWQRDPFSGDIENNKLWGRGAADMKAGLAAAVVALETIAKHKPSVAGTLRLLIPCDEEGMMRGIKRMLQDGWHKDDAGKPAAGAIICEPEELELCLFQRGGIRVKIIFMGKQAHGAMPYAGKNPIPALATFVLAMQELQTELQQQLGSHPMLGHAWLTATVLEAGSWPQLNVMHAQAALGLDIRTVPGIAHQDLHVRLQGILASICTDAAINFQYEIIDDRPWTSTDQNAKLVRALETATRITRDCEPSYGGVPGTTDGTFLHAAGVPIVTVGPGGREIPHQTNEFVELQELRAAAKLYAAAAILFLSQEN